MTESEIEPATVETHQKALAAIATTVGEAGTAASKRLGDMDFGALFAAWVPRVNQVLDDVHESVDRHRTELEQHRASFLRNIAANTATDAGGGSAITGTGGS